ncbi:MAG: type IV secretion system DNA-binding domain-containing protein [Planctomycetota bacterium]|nr:type IV secretion system DNA-binding domain-containing protein [Planctomycetota bacterium]
MPLQDYEKLGVFYLGQEYDLAARARRPELVLYDSQDLTTHAVCVGMTGSGKTGLCMALLEEAAIDGIPAIVIDPKGDLPNLLLQFPELRASDFEPWIDPEEARRNASSVPAAAQAAADRWAKGLAEWNQDGARIARLREAADFVVYTPGSNAGLPVSIVKSFAAPPRAVVEDSEIFAERVSSTATSLLGLVGIDADPLQSREHILLANILDRSWRNGQDLDLAGLIGAIQTPPIQRIGVFELEAFFPAKDRFQLAMRLNNLLASPTFAQWLEGEPLDVGAALHTKAGKPRIAIYSIAHLSDAERMFFVSLLLNQTLSWMRTQSGTSSLRAILYMDEIAGYFPPVANPPSKAPLLTLLKQARAFGLGCVLATQNPVDLDYKGLANCGTWFVGRLQTERDKARLLDGLEGATPGAFDRAAMEQTLAALGKRVFLLHNVHAKATRTFETRFVLSYLRGPMTRTEIQRLMAGRRDAAAPEPDRQAGRRTTPVPKTAAPETVASGGSGAPTGAGSVLPVLPPGIPQHFLPAPDAASRSNPFRPALFASARVYFSDAKLGVATEVSRNLLVFFADGPVPLDWENADAVDFDESSLTPAGPQGASFTALPAEATKPKSYDVWKKALTERLIRSEELSLFQSPSLGLVSQPGETEAQFRLRIAQRAREERDRGKEKLRAKFATKRATLEERVRRARQQVEVQAEQSRDAKVGGAISLGSAIFGAIFGRKALSAGTVGRASTAARGAGRALRESGDVERATETLSAAEHALRELDAQIEAEVRTLEAALDPLTEPLGSVVLKPKKTNVTVRLVTLTWVQ